MFLLHFCVIFANFLSKCNSLNPLLIYLFCQEHTSVNHLAEVLTRHHTKFIIELIVGEEVIHSHLHLLKWLLDPVILVIRLGLDLHPFLLVSNINPLNVAARQLSTLLIQEFIFFFFQLCIFVLICVQLISAEVGQSISDLLLGHSMDTLFIKKVLKRLCHFVLSKYLVNCIAILPYLNFIIFLTEKVSKDVVE